MASSPRSTASTRYPASSSPCTRTSRRPRSSSATKIRIARLPAVPARAGNPWWHCPAWCQTTQCSEVYSKAGCRKAVAFESLRVDPLIPPGLVAGEFADVDGEARSGHGVATCRLREGHRPGDGGSATDGVAWSGKGGELLADAIAGLRARG